MEVVLECEREGCADQDSAFVVSVAAHQYGRLRVEGLRERLVEFEGLGERESALEVRARVLVVGAQGEETPELCRRGGKIRVRLAALERRPPWLQPIDRLPSVAF